MPETLRDRRVRHARSIIMSRPPASSVAAVLLAQSGNVAGLRVLVLGGAPADTMCALMHTECRRAETRLPGCGTEARSADLALVPNPTRENADRVITQAAHALCRNGRIVMALPGAGNGRELLAHCALMLLGAGFELPMLHGRGEIRILSARLGESAGRPA